MKNKILMFDMDGTLYRLNNPSNTYSGSKLEALVNDNARDLILGRGWADESTVKNVMLTGIANKVGLSKYFQNMFGISREEYFNNVWNINPKGMLRDYKEAVEVIKTLTATNTMILLTSAPKIWQTQVCDYLGISKLFETVYTAEDFETKDDIFAKLSQKYNPKLITSIGDQLKTDIKPAQKYGMNTLWVKEPKDIIKLLEI